jgi:hypothetical protein
MTLLILLAQLTTQMPAPETVRSAFAFLYALPADTAAAPMGSWVVDTAATTSTFDQSGAWRIVVTRLADTGDGLRLRDLAGTPGTSPSELAAAAAAVQQLEAQVSRAEAEASVEVTVAAGDAAATAAIVEGRGWNTIAIAGARAAVRRDGHWVRTRDAELEIDVERWTPATLFVRIGSVAVTARGNQQMIDRLVKETRWQLLAELKPGPPLPR